MRLASAYNTQQPTANSKQKTANSQQASANMQQATCKSESQSQMTLVFISIFFSRSCAIEVANCQINNYWRLLQGGARPKIDPPRCLLSPFKLAANELGTLNSSEKIQVRVLER